MTVAERAPWAGHTSGAYWSLHDDYGTGGKVTFVGETFLEETSSVKGRRERSMSRAL